MLNFAKGILLNNPMIRRCALLAVLSLICFLQSNLSAGEPTLLPTPADAEGPFYPVVRQSDEDNDLVNVKGRKIAARGDILYLTGKVVNAEGEPYPNAVVEIWQTDTKGRYKDERDTKPGDRDPDFQYWGKADCAEDGTYSFTTLMPGAYFPRPAHIHFKVWIDGVVRLTSQIYFRKGGEQVDAGFSQHAAPNMQAVDLREAGTGKYEAFFRIVLS